MYNIQSSLEHLKNTLMFIELHKIKVQWLSAINKKYDRIVNFGCSDGYESLALMCFLNANEVVGIDKDSNSIDQAQSLPIHIQQDIQNIQFALRYDNELPNGICPQLQSYIENFKDLDFLKFVVGDMTETKDLPANYFDLAYCERVLYHIVCNSKHTNDNILSAIQEMARVVKHGGMIVAIEPNSCSSDDKTPVELSTFFQQVGLLSVKTNDAKFAQEGKTIYAYAKPLKL